MLGSAYFDQNIVVIHIYLDRRHRISGGNRGPPVLDHQESVLPPEAGRMTRHGDGDVEVGLGEVGDGWLLVRVFSKGSVARNLGSVELVDESQKYVLIGSD